MVENNSLVHLTCKLIQNQCVQRDIKCMYFLVNDNVMMTVEFNIQVYKQKCKKVVAKTRPITSVCKKKDFFTHRLPILYRTVLDRVSLFSFNSLGSSRFDRKDTSIQ